MKKNLVILLHIMAWALFLALPFLLRSGPADINRPPVPFHEHKLFHGKGFDPIYFSLITNILVIPVFYINLYLLFPRYISKKKYGVYVIAQVFLLLVAYIIKYAIIRTLFPQTPPFQHGGLFRDFFFVFTYLFVTLIAFSYGMVQENIRREQYQKEKENEALKSELQFLRWQVNPHFLFNALNNTVALARMKSDKLEPILIKLSTLMRYMLYETSETKILLSKEVEYLQSYIDLQSLRVGGGVTIKTDFGEARESACVIEPMLLIPFIENAFKHGVGLIEDPLIDIELAIRGSTLFFLVRNKHIPEVNKNKDEMHGVGLSNVKRRLELVYKDKYDLNIETNDFFVVSLKIDLS